MFVSMFIYSILIDYNVIEPIKIFQKNNEKIEHFSKKINFILNLVIYRIKNS